MTISKRTIQLTAAGGVLVLFFLCSLVTGGASFFLPEQKNWGLTAIAAFLPMILGLGLAVAAYFVAGRMIKDETDSPPASAPAPSANIFDDATPAPVLPAKKVNKYLFRWLLIGLAGLLLVGIDAIAFVIWRWEVLELVAIEILVAIMLMGIYFLIGWIQSRPRNWMEDTGWPAISGLSLLATVGFFVIAVGGPALGATLADWFGKILPGTAIFGTILGYIVWVAIGVGGLYFYNHFIDGSPSKGVIAVTIALPILVITAFFGFGLIEAIAGSFAKVWLLYAILAAILTAISVDQAGLWESGVILPIVSVGAFAVAWTVSWAILSAVGAAFGMYGQGATIVAVVISYGIYLSWERSSGEGGGS